jgi:hypothetical protein
MISNKNKLKFSLVISDPDTDHVVARVETENYISLLEELGDFERHFNLMA